jgi:hypothetical protein
MAGDRQPFLSGREEPMEAGQRNWLRKRLGGNSAKMWRKLARPVTFFDKPSPPISVRERNLRIL